MKRSLLDPQLVKAIGVGTVLSGMAMLGGCANAPGGGGGTAALPESGPVQGRDLGRGGATAGGVSSLNPSGNAADYSVYDARQIQQQPQQQ